jgi:hypothetical protein
VVLADPESPGETAVRVRLLKQLAAGYEMDQETLLPAGG